VAERHMVVNWVLCCHMDWRRKKGYHAVRVSRRYPIRLECSHPDLILNATSSCSCIRTPGRLVANMAVFCAIVHFTVSSSSGPGQVKLFMPVLNTVLWLAGRRFGLVVGSCLHILQYCQLNVRVQWLKQRFIIIHPKTRHKNISNYLPQKAF
jgi:hypothetical protein